MPDSPGFEKQFDEDAMRIRNVNNRYIIAVTESHGGLYCIATQVQCEVSSRTSSAPCGKQIIAAKFAGNSMEEMAEDNLDIIDIEHAVLNGHLDKN